MASEYVLFDKSELKSLEKTFLMTQMNAISSVKNIREYKKSRAQEFAFKIKIKSFLGEIQNELSVLDKLLPETSFKTEKQEEDLVILPEQKEDKSSSLEDELDRIKRRLALLQ